MKKLSFKERNTDIVRYKTKSNVASMIYSDGFSGFVFEDGSKVMGACCACTSRSCSSYSISELQTNRFSQFPKNPSNRVCPVNAIHFDMNGLAYISSKDCVNCGLCLYRCPFGAIQFNPQDETCYINNKVGEDFVACSVTEQNENIGELRSIHSIIEFKPITMKFSTNYSHNIRNGAHQFSDISEIIVRNTLLNLGCRCNVNAQGNVHTRTEFFAELDDSIIIGESEITNTDTLSVNRRVLDDMAVLINRYGFSKDCIIPLSVINGLPNKRTDYYEVITDIKNVLGIQINTVTYHILFMLQLYRMKISKDMLRRFIIDKDCISLVPPTSEVIKELHKKDGTLSSTNYIPTK